MTPSNNNITLGKKLSSLRGHYRITQKQVEAETGITQDLLSKFENDIRVPHEDQLVKLAVLYHTTINGINNYHPDNLITNTFNDHSKGFFNVEKVIMSNLEEIIQNKLMENPLQKGKELKLTISFKVE